MLSQKTLFIWGAILETLACIGLLLAAILLHLLLKYGNCKLLVSYIPIVSLTLGTVGQLILVVGDEGPELMGLYRNPKFSAAMNFLFFPFWSGILIAVCLLAINRTIMCFNVNASHTLLSPMWMITITVFGWLYGFGVAAAVAVTSYTMERGYFRFRNEDDDLTVDGDVANVSEVITSTTNVNYVFVVTQIMDCLAIFVSVVCYVVVVWHIRKRRRILDGHNSQLALSITNTISVVFPRSNAVFTLKTPLDCVQDYNSRTSRNSTSQPNYCTITVQFIGITCSVGCFAVFLCLNTYWDNDYGLPTQYTIHTLTSLINVFLISTVNSKIKRKLINLLKCEKVIELLPTV